MAAPLNLGHRQMPLRFSFYWRHVRAVKRLVDPWGHMHGPDHREPGRVRALKWYGTTHHRCVAEIPIE